MSRTKLENSKQTRRAGDDFPNRNATAARDRAGDGKAVLAKAPRLPPTARVFLEVLIKSQLVLPPEADLFLDQAAEYLADYKTPETLGSALVQAGLLTDYQLSRALAGTTHGLIFGNYRVLDRLGSGAMGVVFLGEHMLMKRRTAIKVLPLDDDCPLSILERFYSEVRVLADLHHPHIVLAFDAGHLSAAGPRMPALVYLVMELVRGGDLEQYLGQHGAASVAQACKWIRQAACGLQEAHDHHLIHRDVKPSNLLLTDRGDAKIVDFGLVRQFSSHLTDPRGLLGTIEYMAPEQSYDPSGVDGRADVYGLGATLFGLLTGQLPFPPARSVAEGLRMLRNNRPRKLRELRRDAPADLEKLIDWMMEKDPGQRPAMPITVMNALLPFTAGERIVVGTSGKSDPDPAGAGPQTQATKQKEREEIGEGGQSAGSLPGPDAGPAAAPKRILLVDDEERVRALARSVLEPLGCQCEGAPDGTTALQAAQSDRYDVVLLDLNLPDVDGFEVCRQLRERPALAYLKIIVVSGRGDQNQLAEALPRGADDYMTKPFGIGQLAAKVKHALRLKAAQEEADALARQLTLTNRQLEASLAARISDVRQAQDALLFAMAKMAESRDGETSGHLRRLQRYTRLLAQRAAAFEPTWAGLVNSTFLEQLERCVPLHDIGKIGLPESVLLKPGKLTSEERALMETHTVIGDRILRSLGQEHGESLVFLGMARSIVRHHHERYDGAGYPDRLLGEAIPAAARLVAVADVYDALRRQRFHKLALSHSEAMRILLQDSQGQFDPALSKALAHCERDFERIYREVRT
jgi:response regulator RpfG family c-di-GMP phosphodiesterase/tRNA A-37 threonylcarbamoyl transferase component Bud32